MADWRTDCGGSIVMGREYISSHLVYASVDSAGSGRGEYPRATISWSESCRADSSVSAGRTLEPLGAGMEVMGAGMSAVGEGPMWRWTGWVVTVLAVAQSSCKATSSVSSFGTK